MKLRVRPSRIRGEVAVPGSKSHTIRGLIAALAADGESRLVAPLYSADTLAVRRAAETLGMRVREDGRDWVCLGTGGNFRAPDGTRLDLANSGTGLRFFSAMAAMARRTSISLRPAGRSSERRRAAVGMPA